MMRFIRQHLLAVTAASIVALGVLAWLAFGYFGVHTLFVDETVSEAAPVFDQSAEATPPEVSAPPTGTTPPTTTGTSAPPPAVDVGGTPQAEPTTSESVAEITPTTTTRPAAVATEYSGGFTSEAHPTSGTAIVLGNGTGQRFLRFEDFETDNGPDLNVYLVNSSTGDVSDYIDLGDLKGNIGEQNYEIPSNVDLERYDQVVIWCVRFTVGFGRADLAPI